jgi:Urocanase Rossmann-like domain
MGFRSTFMTANPVPQGFFDSEVAAIYRLYAALATEFDGEFGLGGKLLFVAELDDQGCRLVRAANIAGAASLSATAEVDLQKQAIRDAVVDFLVTSLDEAVRILKNEIRKRQPVAVCVAAKPESVAAEMAGRGIRPDLDSRSGAIAAAPARSAAWSDPAQDAVLVAWSVSSAPTRWLPRLDELALECLDREAGAARRWIQQAPRYLGRLGREFRLVSASREFGWRFVERVRERCAAGEVGASGQIQLTFRGGCDAFSFGTERSSSD